MTRRRYDVYKDSGGAIGEIPTHWEAQRLKFVATYRTSNVDKKSDDGERTVRLCNYTDVYYRERIRPDQHFMDATATAAEVARFHLHAGDVLITKDSEDWRDIAIPALVEESADDLLCGYHLGIVRPGSRAWGPFLLRVLQSEAVNWQFQIASTGVTRFGLPNGAATNVRLPIPPQEEQRVIAAFLDRETAKIDTLIAKKRLLIERLEEQRTALISRAVTRGLPPEAARAAGLDPSPRLEHAEWLGDIPGHWESLHLRRVARFITSGSRGWAEHYSDEGDIFVRIGNLKRGSLGIDLNDVQHVRAPKGAEAERTRVQPGDLLFSITAYLGSVAVADERLRGAYINQHIALVRLDHSKAVPHFVALVILSRLGQAQLDAQGYGGTKVQLAFEDIEALRLPIPPLPEQQAIVDYLQQALHRLEELQSTVDRAIDRLQEYRTALITAAVTGEIDVRESVPGEIAAG